MNNGFPQIDNSLTGQTRRLAQTTFGRLPNVQDQIERKNAIAYCSSASPLSVSLFVVLKHLGFRSTDISDSTAEDAACQPRLPMRRDGLLPKT